MLSSIADKSQQVLWLSKDELKKAFAGPQAGKTEAMDDDGDGQATGGYLAINPTPEVREFFAEVRARARAFEQEHPVEFGAEITGDGTGQALPPITAAAQVYQQSGSFKAPSDAPPKALHPADESMTVPYGATMQRSGASLFLLCSNSMDEFWAKASAARDRGRPLAFSRPSGELIWFGRVVDVRGLTGRDEYQVEIELGDVK